MDAIDILRIDLFSDGFSDSECYINTLSDHLSTSHKHINRPHKHDFYTMVLFTKGSGIHEIEFERYEVRPGSLYYLSPGQTHNWDLSHDADGFVVFHSAEFYNLNSGLDTANFLFYAQASGWRQPVLPEHEIREFATLFRKIQQEKATAGNKSRFMILSLLTQLYILSERRIDAERPVAAAHDSYHAKHIRFLELLEKHYAEVKSIRQYADWLHITPKHLNRINKALVNKTTSDIITGRVILEAKRMLSHTDLNFAEIALRLGYPDYAYFSKVFRKQEGVSPSAFVKGYASLQ